MSRSPLTPSGPSGRLLGNLPFLFMENFKLIGFFLPSMVCLLAFLLLGGLVFLLGALLLLLPAAPALSAMYDICYQILLDIPDGERSRFMESYRLNARQSIASLALTLPLMILPLVVLVVPNQLPMPVLLSVLVGCLLAQTFSVLAFSQIVLTDKPLKEIWKTALMIIPLTGWRGIAAAMLQLVFLAAMVQYLPIMFFVAALGGSALLMGFSCKILWPAMERLLAEEPD